MKKITLLLLLILMGSFASAQAPDAKLGCGLGNYLKIDASLNIPLTLTNAGPGNVTNAEISWTLDGGAPMVHAVRYSGAGMQPNYYSSLLHSKALTITEPGVHVVKVWVSSVNGMADPNEANSTLEFKIKTVSAKDPKNVLFEKFTGGWCIHCPAINCNLNKLLEVNKNVLAVDVHDNDAMQTKYNAPMKSKYGVNAFPTAMVDRRKYPGEPRYPLSANTALTSADFASKSFSPIDVDMSQLYDAETRKLTVQVYATAVEDVTGTFMFNCILTEDSIPATIGTRYEQKLASQYYTDRNNCWYGNTSPMKNYFHNHVQREILGGITGDVFASGRTVKAGETFFQEYVFDVPAEWNDKQMHIIGFAEGTDTDVNYEGTFNATKQKLGDISTSTLGKLTSVHSVNIYPNPANQAANLEFTSIRSQNVKLSVHNSVGTLVHQNNVSATADVPVNYTWNVQDVPAGLYVVSFEMDGKKVTRKLLIQP